MSISMCVCIVLMYVCMLMHMHRPITLSSKHPFCTLHTKPRTHTEIRVQYLPSTYLCTHMKASLTTIQIASNAKILVQPVSVRTLLFLGQVSVGCRLSLRKQRCDNVTKASQTQGYVYVYTNNSIVQIHILIQKNVKYIPLHMYVCTKVE